MPTEITTDRLRELAETRATPGKVLSVFINLDPRHFAAPPARATEIASVLDAAARTIRDHADLTDAERSVLTADVERIRRQVRAGAELDGARGLAVFACETAGLFEVIKLPRPVEHKVAIGDTPCVEPLARIGTGEPWWLLLVDRRRARLLAGTLDGLVELWRQDDEISRRHDQGGWSQARLQRAVDKEAEDHLRAVDHELRRRLLSTRIAGLLLAGPNETTRRLWGLMHSEVARHVKGRFDADVWNSSPDDVLQAARPLLEELDRRRDEELRRRIEEELATDGRAAAGLEQVLLAVHERRIDTLAVQDGLAAKGTRCPRCGRLGVSAGAMCPGDGAVTEAVDDVVSDAVSATLAQKARVRWLPADDPFLAQHGGVAALLRF